MYTDIHIYMYIYIYIHTYVFCVFIFYVYNIIDPSSLRWVVPASHHQIKNFQSERQKKGWGGGEGKERDCEKNTSTKSLSNKNSATIIKSLYNFEMIIRLGTPPSRPELLLNTFHIHMYIYIHIYTYMCMHV